MTRLIGDYETKSFSAARVTILQFSRNPEILRLFHKHVLLNHHRCSESRFL